jgi:hypothetical protein
VGASTISVPTSTELSMQDRIAGAYSGRSIGRATTGAAASSSTVNGGGAARTASAAPSMLRNNSMIRRPSTHDCSFRNLRS